MIITELTIHHLRNIETAQFTLHPKCHLFHGENGSGKTSLLEAIYLLCTGHSFRTRETSPLIRYGASAFTVFAQIQGDATISIQKSLLGPTQVKLNREPCRSSSQLARLFPCLVFYQDMFQIIDAGPAVRRTLLDWGLFHVEQSYHRAWKDYRWVLKQRNALLRQKAARSAFDSWDQQLSTLALELDRMRGVYFEQWVREFNKALALLTDMPCHLTYEKGWDRKESGYSLQSILRNQLDQDIQRQYTQSGPHQADIRCEVNSKAAKRMMSRGQQKLVLIALKLAQAVLVPGECLFLLDDLPAELDAEHLQRVLKSLTQIEGQKVFTALDDKVISLEQGNSTFLAASGL
ncbi:MAG: DNA replication/repair protein RecF [Legionellales bacterium]|nr:DNA replication/repair protein RecF [Legionellales bacterium]